MLCGMTRQLTLALSWFPHTMHWMHGVGDAMHGVDDRQIAALTHFAAHTVI